MRSIPRNRARLLVAAVLVVASAATAARGFVPPETPARPADRERHDGRVEHDLERHEDEEQVARGPQPQGAQGAGGDGADVEAAFQPEHIQHELRRVADRLHRVGRERLMISEEGQQGGQPATIRLYSIVPVQGGQNYGMPATRCTDRPSGRGQ